MHLGANTTDATCASLYHRCIHGHAARDVSVKPKLAKLGHVQVTCAHVARSQAECGARELMPGSTYSMMQVGVHNFTWS